MKKRKAEGQHELSDIVLSLPSFIMSSENLPVRDVRHQWQKAIEEYFCKNRDSVTCPHCSHSSIGRESGKNSKGNTRNYRFRCRGCNKNISFTTLGKHLGLPISNLSANRQTLSIVDDIEESSSDDDECDPTEGPSSNIVNSIQPNDAPAVINAPNQMVSVPLADFQNLLQQVASISSKLEDLSKRLLRSEEENRRLRALANPSLPSVNPVSLLCTSTDTAGRGRDISSRPASSSQPSGRPNQRLSYSEALMQRKGLSREDAKQADTAFSAILSKPKIPSNVRLTRVYARGFNRSVKISTLKNALYKNLFRLSQILHISFPSENIAEFLVTESYASDFKSQLDSKPGVTILKNFDPSSPFSPEANEDLRAKITTAFQKRISHIIKTTSNSIIRNFYAKILAEKNLPIIDNAILVNQEILKEKSNENQSMDICAGNAPPTTSTPIPFRREDTPNIDLTCLETAMDSGHDQ
jgi:hypothetical protein